MLTKEDVLDTIKHHMSLVIEDFDADSFDPVKSMLDHGANSLELVEIVSRTMRQLGVKVPRLRLNRVTNIDELANEIVQFSAKPEQA